MSTFNYTMAILILISFLSKAMAQPIQNCSQISSTPQAYQQACHIEFKTYNCDEIQQKMISRGESTSEFRDCLSTQEEDFLNSVKECATPILMGVASVSKELIFRLLNGAWGLDALISVTKSSLQSDKQCLNDIERKKILIQHFNNKVQNIAKISDSHLIPKIKFSVNNLENLTCSEIIFQMESRRKALLQEINILKANNKLSSLQKEEIDNEFNQKNPPIISKNELGIPTECLKIEKRAEITCEYIAASFGLIDIAKTSVQSIKKKYSDLESPSDFDFQLSHYRPVFNCQPEPCKIQNIRFEQIAIEHIEQRHISLISQEQKFIDNIRRQLAENPEISNKKLEALIKTDFQDSKGSVIKSKYTKTNVTTLFPENVDIEDLINQIPKQKLTEIPKNSNGTTSYTFNYRDVKFEMSVCTSPPCHLDGQDFNSKNGVLSVFPLCGKNVYQLRAKGELIKHLKSNSSEPDIRPAPCN